MSAYIGVMTDVPIYEDITVHSPPFKLDTVNEFFYVTGRGTGYSQWTYEGMTDSNGDYIKLTKNNRMTDTTGASTVLTALYDISNVSLTGTLYAAYYGTFTVTVAGTTLVSTSGKAEGVASSGGNVATLPINWSGTLHAGEKIVIQHTKSTPYTNTPEARSELFLRCGEWEYVVTEIVGYEPKVLPKTIQHMHVVANNMPLRVTKGYVVADGTPKLFHVGDLVEYTGEYTVDKITVGDKTYKLYTLLTSGELTLRDSLDVWMCGGGAGGQHGVSLVSGSTYYDANRATNGGYGGGGGYSTSATLPKGTYAVTVGAGGHDGNVNGSSTEIKSGNTTHMTVAGGKSNGRGGSGGGAGGYAPDRTVTSVKDGASGDGTSTYPFGITALGAHCAGGGGGSAYFEYKNSYTHSQRGGDGGTNGGNGGSSEEITSTTVHSVGGVKGGGDGAAYGSSGEATAATFYGSGGGGGRLNQVSALFTGGSLSRSLGKAGYQGVVYVLAEGVYPNI